MTSPVLTILTPTWNRRHLLPRLYSSLVEQEAPVGSFEWLVVDDGSTDGTEQWLASICGQTNFPIRVIRRENGGKHRAVNQAARALVSPWVMINDSDDWLFPQGLERALGQIRQVDADPAVKAIVASREIVGEGVPARHLPSRPISFAQWMRLPPMGDTSTLLRSEILQAFPFPEYVGENFIAESSAHAVMFRDGGILLSNETIVKGEYQFDGLSARSVALRAANSYGAMHTYRAHLQARPDFGHRIRCLLNYHRFYWHALSRSQEPRRLGFRRNPVWMGPAWLLYQLDLRTIGGD